MVLVRYTILCWSVQPGASVVTKLPGIVWTIPGNGGQPLMMMWLSSIGSLISGSMGIPV